MRILQAFDLSPDEYTLLCEVAKQKPQRQFVLHERTLLYALSHRKLPPVRESQFNGLWELTNFGYAALEEIELRVALSPRSGPAKLYPFKR